MRLFAERGFGATSVADIEMAVGLQPRRGGLYKHFTNKHALLEAAVRTHLEDARTVARQLEDLDIPSAASTEPAALRTLVIELGTWFLSEMDRLEHLTRVLEHDAARVPELTDAVRTEIVDLSYRAAARVIARLAPQISDAEATAVVVLGTLVAVRRTRWTFGAAPVGIDDDRMLDTLADVILAALGASAPAR
jgi:AcrR family transcriptional regulator